MKGRQKNTIKKNTFIVFAILLTAILMSTIKLPYYVTYPGDAEPLDDMVLIEDKESNAKGHFMLTTIRIGKASLIQYIVSHFSNYQFLIPENQIKREWESDKDYDHRQLKMMENSQYSAVLVAYTLANKYVEIKNRGVLVTGLIPNMPASEKLIVGDIVTAVDDLQVQTVDQLLAYLGKKQKGETIVLSIEREGTTESIELTMQSFPASYASGENGDKVGIGIVNPVTHRTMVTQPEIVFKTDGIGGPSAGLMFALEIYNRLIDEDITKGYNIAGTGEIFENGKVGAIGGIKQKIVAAHNSNVHIFFAPEAGNNYKDAKAAALDIGTDMKIVPVTSIEDAIQYLKAL